MMDHTRDRTPIRPPNGAKSRTVLTTGQVAKICSVAPRTVSKWFDTGQLRGYRIPGSKDRRIPVDQLVRFMKEHGMPTDRLDVGAVDVLIVDDDADFTALLSEAIGAGGDYAVSVADSAFEAGVMAQQLQPAVIVVDVSLHDIDARRIVKTLRTNERLGSSKLIATSGLLTEGQCQSLLQEGFSGFLRKPFEVRQIQELIDRLVSNGDDANGQ
ncbi:MAG: response regulator [Planctomycetes bacterium]|nr:response regulator [Planctomycetota bacterium]